MKIDTPRYPFPLIECGEHPGPQRSYVVCIHVIDGAEPKHIFPATDTTTGEILCEREQHDIADYRLMCAGHAEERYALVQWMRKKTL
jgi:hypothetical protein